MQDHDVSNFNDDTQSRLDSNPARTEQAYGEGNFSSHLIEPMPRYRRADSETVIMGENNSYIVLGRDRPSHEGSGASGRGATQAGSIDLVVGRQGATPGGPQDGDTVMVDNMIFGDSARITISQKTNVDNNFDIAEGQISRELQANKSAVALKADHVRMVGREGIKIVTGRGNNVQAGLTGELNALGGFIAQPAGGIELIAGNNTDDSDTLQPVPLGRNLVSCVEEMANLISLLNGKLLDFATAQIRFNGRLAAHTHVVATPTGPGLAAPSVEAIAGFADGAPKMTMVALGCYAHKLEIALFELNYLREYGFKWICSENVRTT